MSIGKDINLDINQAEWKNREKRVNKQINK